MLVVKLIDVFNHKHISSKLQNLKKMKLIFSILMIAMSATLFGQNAFDNFEGTWKTQEGQIITITLQGDSFVGTASKNGKTKTILSNIIFTGKKWKGELKKPKDGTKLNCELKLKGNELKLKVKKGFASKTLTWTKQ